MKTILIVGKLPPPYYGPAVATQIILSSSLKEHYNLLHFNTKLNEDISGLGKIRISKLIRLISHYIKLWRTLRSNDVSLLILPLSQSSWGVLKDGIYAIISNLCKVPYLIHLRGSKFLTVYQGMSSLLKCYTKRIIIISEGAIVLGTCLRYIFEPFLPSLKIHVIPNGGNYPDLNYTKKTNDKCHLLYIGNLYESKGVLDVVESMKILNKEYPHIFQLDLVGNWGDQQFKNKCMQLVNENHLPVNVRNNVNREKSNFLSKADVFIFPPREPEGHPWVIIEALAAGLPIISTDKGSIRQSVVENENGYIVKDRSPEQLADKILRLYHDKDLRERFGLSSRHLYEKSFTEKSMVEKFRETIERTLIKSKT